MKRIPRMTGILLTLLLVMSYSSIVYGQENNGSDSDTTLAPYFIVRDSDSPVDSFPLKETKVETNINGIIAETRVTQVYTNEGTVPINASYVFPASAKVSVHGMTMEIGDRVVTARIREKEEARQEYEEAKSEGKSASLLEEQRPNVFTMDVANVMPGDQVIITLLYTELIESAEGTYQFVFPTVSGPRYQSPSEESPGGDQWVESPFLPEGEAAPGKYEISLNLNAPVPITELKSGSHNIDVVWEKDTSAHITLSNPEEFAGNRDFILDYRLTGEEMRSGLMLYKGETENFFMLMVQPPERFTPDVIPPREYIFVLDVSGSMSGYPLDTAKVLIRNLVKNLRDTDSFNLILFADDTTLMSPESVPASEENISRAIDMIDRQAGGGGTELLPALENAVALPPQKNAARSIVTITDGYLSGEKEVFNLVNRNSGKAGFFSFGIGSSVNRYLIEGIAGTGAGESFVVTDPSEAAKTAERFRVYIQSPLLTDVRVTCEGFDAFEIQPSSVSTLYAQRPIVMYGKWIGEPAGTIRITGKSGEKDYIQEIPVDTVIPSENNEALRYLWARKKVQMLTDYATTQEEQEAVKKEVTTLGLNYSMITPYTSFIAVTEEIRNANQKSTDVNQPSPLPENVSPLAVGGVYRVGSEPGDILPVLLLIFLTVFSIVRHKGKNTKTVR